MTIDTTVYAHGIKALEGADELSVSGNFDFTNSAFSRMLEQNSNNPEALTELRRAARDFVADNPNSKISKELMNLV